MIQGNLLGLGLFVFAAIFIAIDSLVLKQLDWIAPELLKSLLI